MLAVKWLEFARFYLLRHKDDSASKFKDYPVIVSQRYSPGHRICVIRFDYGGKGMGAAFGRVCANVSLKREHPKPHAH